MPSRLAAVAAAFLFTGCGGGMVSLKMTEPSRSLAQITPLRQKMSVPIAVKMFAADSPPTIDGKFNYPLRQYLEKAFKDAMAGAFDEREAAYGYTIEVTANSSELKTTNNKGQFAADLTSVIRGPDNRVRGDAIPFRATIESNFDRKQVPDSVWTVSYKASKEVLETLRKARWFKADLQDLSAGAVAAAPRRQQPGVQPPTTVPTAEDEPKRSKCKQVRSDVDTPGFQSKEDPDKYALVVGIETYQNIPDATCAEHDAMAVRENLLALGYPERNITVLVGDRATRSKLVSYIEQWYPRNLNENSRLFVYYSGHGAPDPETKQAYILPWDADPKFLESSAYSVKNLYAKLNALPAKNVLVAMDSCFSGAGGKSVIAEGTRPLVPVMTDALPEKLVVFAAAGAEETTGAKNDQGHGLFTYYFLKGLSGDAANRKTGAITSDDLFGYLSNKVKDAASRDNRPQTPQLLKGTSDSNPLIKEP